MDSSRVLLALHEKLKWEGRKQRIIEKLKAIRLRKHEALIQLEEAKSRITQLTTIVTMNETDRPSGEAGVRIEGLR